mgnify:CR=1 FL=1
MCYELLRDGIVQPDGRRPGWALFVRKGMAAWLDAWHGTVQRESPDPVPPRSGLVLAGQAQQNEIVVVWTGMVLGHVSEGSCAAA